MLGGTGGDTFYVKGTAADCTTTIYSQGPDDFVVGDSAGVQDNKGVLAIDNLSSTSQPIVIVDDSADAIGRSVTVTAGSIAGLAPAAIELFGVLSSLAIEGGTGTDHFAVNGTAAGYSTVIYTRGAGLVVVGDSAGARDIAGSLSIDNLSSTSRPSLVVDDTADATGRSVTISSGRIDGLAPAAISYVGAYGYVEVEGGTGSDVFSLNSTAAGYTTELDADGPGEIDVSDSTGLQDIKGPLTIVNKSAAAPYLTLSDHFDTTARTATFAAGLVSGLSPAPIRYSGGFGYLEVFGGTGGGTSTIQGTSAGYGTYIVPGDTGTVRVGNAGSVQGVTGPLWVENVTTHSTLIVDDDSADQTLRAPSPWTTSPPMASRPMGGLPGWRRR